MNALFGLAGGERGVCLELDGVNCFQRVGAFVHDFRPEDIYHIFRCAMIDPELDTMRG